MEYFSIVARRERALQFCYGYYFMAAGDEADQVQNGLSMVLDTRPLSGKERDGIVGLIENDRGVRAHYICMFKESGRRYS